MKVLDLIDRNELYKSMTWEMAGTGYQQNALATIRYAESVDPIHACSGCYCSECVHAEEGTDDDGEPIYFCHFNPDFKLSWLKANDFCSLGTIGKYQEEEIE